VVLSRIGARELRVRVQLGGNALSRRPGPVAQFPLGSDGGA
jgi:hypothetical protein